MMTRLLGLSLALLLSTLWLEMPAVQAEEAKPIRILMVTLSKGYEHSSVHRPAPDKLSAAEVAVTQLGLSSKAFTVHCTKDVANDFTKENLQNYDLVWFYTTGNLGIPKETLDYFFTDWLKQKGHGFIGTHSASDTYGDFEPYWDMVGGTFNGHPWGSGELVTVSVHEPHPTVAMFGDEFQIKDEIYQYKNWQPAKVRVLMSLNMAKCKTKKDYHVPVCWVKDYGKGRVFYTNLGHNETTWANEKVLQHLLAGVKWAAGRIDGEAQANPELSKEQEEKAKSDAQ